MAIKVDIALRFQPIMFERGARAAVGGAGEIGDRERLPLRSCTRLISGREKRKKLCLVINVAMTLTGSPLTAERNAD